MDDWVEELSHALSRGLALTFDYGHEARDLYSPARSGAHSAAITTTSLRATRTGG